MKTLSFGEILFDIIEGAHYLGGAPLNFAAHLAQCGQESYIFSCLGADELGKQAYQLVEELGVNTSFIHIDERHPTGTVEVRLENGQPDYTICEDVAYDFIDLEGKGTEIASIDFDVLYFGTLAQRSPQSAEALKWLIANNEFQEIFYDINLRKNGYTKATIHNSLQLCTILKLNDDEVNVLSDMFYQKQLCLELFLEQVVRDFNIRIVIVTAGDKGCYVYHSGKLSFIKGHPVQVIDTIGAGDSFSAAFVYHYFKHQDALQAAKVANKLGAYVAGSRGAIPPYSPEIKKILATDK